MLRSAKLCAVLLGVLLGSSLLAEGWAGEAPLFVAHRGQSGTAPENTIQAFEEAVAGGARAIETDVRITADGVPILLHDKDVSRVTTGQGNVDNLTLKQIAELQLRRGALQIPDARIPSFADFIQFLSKHPSVQAYVEIKGYRNQRDIDLILSDIGQCSSCNLRLSSFRLGDLAYVRKRNKTIPLDYIVSKINDSEAMVEQMASLGGDMSILAYYKELLANGDTVARLRRAGIKVGAWTVPDRSIADELVAMGVSPIIADKPLAP
ncbi:glycerophosphodiester phosphodiesterase [Chelatococcus asaccharovorans]|uniref:glycerophosphodiester phosphodiesterase n=1 Tax=Chelatococcus asaccharovorans TaxID=28210 RepID=UPI00224C6EFB|nr:glycerophosphodiester phosphodiesterase family protein [Chelatococcus asaccharovorans]CAH1664387.1 Glycerophosphoryl diester phosphodiesterase [Chelatococcus asaccharovorans]CAH1682422.1 Glycerophosphoryl diester phosphodiesterase [Chelatococcus asaccharovorans]